MARMGSGRGVEGSNYKHGLIKNPIYNSWVNMKARVLDPKNPQFKDYGGRGIDIDPRYIDKKNGFLNWYADIGPKPSNQHSQDRIDNERGYWPDNIRWATRKEQMQNRKVTVWYTYNGRMMAQADWARELNVSPNTILAWMRKGKTFEWVYNHFKNGHHLL